VTISILFFFYREVTFPDGAQMIKNWHESTFDDNLQVIRERLSLHDKVSLPSPLLVSCNLARSLAYIIPEVAYICAGAARSLHIGE
jgi:hypothetical protein